MIDLSVTLLIAAVFGFLFGSVYFAWLWRSVASFVSSRRTSARFLLGVFLRLAALAAVVGALLWLEIAPLLLLAGGLGFFVARLAATTVLARPANEV